MTIKEQFESLMANIGDKPKNKIPKAKTIGQMLLILDAIDSGEEVPKDIFESLDSEKMKFILIAFLGIMIQDLK